MVVVVVRTDDLTHVFLHMSQWKRRKRVAEHLGVRLTASPPPWASTSRWTEAEKCCKTAANYPSSPSASQPCTAGTVRTRLCGDKKVH